MACRARDDQERGSAVEADFLEQAPFTFGPCESFDQFGECAAIDTLAGLDGSDAKPCRQMRFSGAGRAEKMDDLGSLDELELSERHDAIAIQGRLEGEIETLEGLGRGQPGGGHGDTDPPAFADGEFLSQQGVYGLEGGELAPLDLLHGMIERFESAGHAQANEMGGNAIQA